MKTYDLMSSPIGKQLHGYLSERDCDELDAWMYWNGYKIVSQSDIDRLENDLDDFQEEVSVLKASESLRSLKNPVAQLQEVSNYQSSGVLRREYFTVPHNWGELTTLELKQRYDSHKLHIKDGDEVLVYHARGMIGGEFNTLMSKVREHDKDDNWIVVGIVKLEKDIPLDNYFGFGIDF
jgi:hypothetical protein